MDKDTQIQTSLPADGEALTELYPAAFPDEDLLPLVDQLLDEKEGVLSLVATNNGTVIGHSLFTRCSVSGHDQNVALLGPVCVTPARQKHGIGSRLIRDGLNRLKDEAIKEIYVLGDPNYYSRFGFKAEDKVTPPYPLPEEWYGAWQSLSLCDTGYHFEGLLCVPKPWNQPSLWMP